MVFLEGHTVAMVTYCATKILTACSPMTVRDGRRILNCEGGGWGLLASDRGANL